MGFRAFVVREAAVLGIAGEVWNTIDGAVELLAVHGDPSVLAALERKLARGPGRVDRVVSRPVDADPANGFVIGATR